MGVSKLHINCTGDNSMRDSVPEMKERVPGPCPVIRTGFCCPWRALSAPHPEQLSSAQKARLFPGTASDTHPHASLHLRKRFPGGPCPPHRSPLATSHHNGPGRSGGGYPGRLAETARLQVGMERRPAHGRAAAEHEPHLSTLRSYLGRQPPDTSQVRVRGMWFCGKRRPRWGDEYLKGGTRPARP